MTPRTRSRLDANTDDQRTAMLEMERILITSGRRQGTNKVDENRYLPGKFVGSAVLSALDANQIFPGRIFDG